MQLYAIKYLGIWRIAYLTLSSEFLPDITIDEASPVWIDSHDDSMICECGNEDRRMKLPS